MKRIIILGGGVGGTVAANVLAKKLKKEAKIVLISKSEKHIYQPSFLSIATGRIKDESKIIREEKEIIGRNIELIIDEASRIDLENRKISLKSGKQVDYDYLVISTGSRIVPEEIKGYEISYTFYSLDGARKLNEALEKFKGGTIAVGIAGIPYKCPPAPSEFCFLIDQYFRKKGIRDKVEIHFLSPLPRPFPHEAVAKELIKLMEEKRIYFHPMFNIEYIDPEKKTVYSLEGESFKFDMLVMVPPHRGSEVIEKSELGVEGGWIPVDKHTLQYKNYSEVYAIGDATNLPISKAGSVAHFEAKIVAERISSEIKGYGAKAIYDGKVICFIESGFRKAGYIKFNYENPPKEPSFNYFWYIGKMMINKFYWSLVLKGTI